MEYAAVAASLLFVILLVSFNVRSNGWRNRRKNDRRAQGDRRVANGRRKNNGVNEDEEHPDRRHNGNRRVGPETRRHKKRRAEDRLGHS